MPSYESYMMDREPEERVHIPKHVQGDCKVLTCILADIKIRQRGTVCKFILIDAKHINYDDARTRKRFASIGSKNATA
jgi:hypothetical protein